LESGDLFKFHQQSNTTLARTVFHTLPHGIAQRNDAARATDYAAMAVGMAQGWSQGLPLGAATI
jgi:hypothetical protein